MAFSSPTLCAPKSFARTHTGAAKFGPAAAASRLSVGHMPWVTSVNLHTDQKHVGHLWSQSLLSKQKKNVSGLLRHSLSWKRHLLLNHSLPPTSFFGNVWCGPKHMLACSCYTKSGNVDRPQDSEPTDEHTFLEPTSFLIGFAIGCLVSALLPLTACGLFLCQRRVQAPSQPVRSTVFTVTTADKICSMRSPAQESEGKSATSRELVTPHLALEGTAGFEDLPRKHLEKDGASSRFQSVRPAVEQDVGLLFDMDDVTKQERIESASGAGPSGDGGSFQAESQRRPADYQSTSANLTSQLAQNPSASFVKGQSEDIDLRNELSNSVLSGEHTGQSVHGLLRTQPVWDAPQATSFSSKHSLPFLAPPHNPAPFPSQAVWDSGLKPERTALPIPSPIPNLPAQDIPPSKPLRSSPIQFCSQRLHPYAAIFLGPSKSNSFVRRAAKRVGPAVVRLNTERNQANEAGGKDLFSKFFGGEDLVLEERAKDREQGQGSGFVVDGKRGIIATNAHVINRADTVLVTLTDGRTYKGSVVGTDELTDLAVIKVELSPGDTLPTAPLGDSNRLEVGDWVIAVGNPFGLDSTVTLGIISSLHRQAAEIGIPEKRVDFLQTDCAINPGNSGGPLLNECGEVVGINTAIRADAEGISFAIPINYARKIVDSLSQGLPVRHAYIGVQVVTITPQLARQHNSEQEPRGEVPEVRGVLVAHVADGSPAEASGLQPGDVILEMNGSQLFSTGELQRVVAYADVGQVIKVKSRRGNHILIRNIVAGDLTPLLANVGAARKS